MLHRQIMPTQAHAAANMQRRIARNPALRHKLNQMRLNLSPLVQITTGQVHPDFPRTVLQFWLLTDHQLESIADFYHQRRPSDLTYLYPCPVAWDSNLPLEAKRRRIGSFIGLRGCCHPLTSPPPPHSSPPHPSSPPPPSSTHHHNHRTINTTAAAAAAAATTAAATPTITLPSKEKPIHLKSECDIADEARFAARAAHDQDLARPKLACWRPRSDF